MENSPKNCVRMCSKAGFAFAGVEWGQECFCGHNPPDKDKRLVINQRVTVIILLIIVCIVRIDDSECYKPCPAGDDRCGGDWALSVFFTGVRVSQPSLPPIPTQSIKIAFIITVYGTILYKQ